VMLQSQRKPGKRQRIKVDTLYLEVGNVVIFSFQTELPDSND
jgi:hypothetical protein